MMETELFPPNGSTPEDKRGRRRSWHIKMERKRRKGVFGSGGAPGAGTEPVTRLLNERHKRPSWWNIFVPDHWPHRSRRASQDLSRSSDDGGAGTWVRSKSRSVDHGFSAPFDLDSLRSKVEGRFESVDRLSRDSDGGSKEGLGTALAEKKSGKGTPPINTTTYTVAASDTLTSVAARFDTTPSELAEINRLNTRLLFPGQVLQVPLKENESDSTQPESAVPGSHELGPTSDISDVPERAPTPLLPPPPIMEGSVDSEVAAATERRFLKINVRHITDGQGVVGGVLLVTPNAVMFDPNVSDPLVIEHGPESYGVIAPMEFVANAAIYHDIAHMRVGSSSDHSTSSGQKPEVYHPRGGPRSPGKDSLLVKDETFPELAPDNDDNESVCSCPGRGGDAFPKAFERDLVSLDSCASSNTAAVAVEERRRSVLDHHWAVPSMDRGSTDKADGEGDEAEQQGRSSQLVKSSCHDSGIDIRDAGVGDHAAPGAGTGHLPVNVDEVPSKPSKEAKLPIEDDGDRTPQAGGDGEDEDEEEEIIVPTKKVFSDADIILAPKTEWVPPITTYNGNSLDTTTLTDGGSRKKTSSVSFSLESNPESEGKDSGEDSQKGDDLDRQESRKNKMLKRLSYPLAWMEGLTGEKDEKDVLVGLPSQTPTHPPPSADGHHGSVFSKVFSRRSSVGTFIRQHEPRPQPPKPAAPRLDYRSMVSMDDMPELFVSFDKLIPRPARSCEDPPLYLRLRMGKPINKKIPKSTPIMSYGKKKMRPEYWFSVPRNRVDELYNFLMVWVPHLYGELEELEVKARGYELVESDTELWEDESGDGNGKDRERSGSGGEEGELGDLTRESWEVLSMSEELRRALYASSVASLDLDPFIPDLVGTTEILSEEHRKQLSRHLPARAEGYVWTLVFSTSQHGFSLNSMYRKMNRLESPILMVIEDTEQNVFGALTSCSLKVSDHFYGTGESLLFRFTPEFQVFNWTGDNMYFIKGNNESLAIGAGDGKFGLWLDGDLYQGRTEACDTYGNEPLSPQQDFVVKTLECWAFI
ncbi:oxidation resistance protein 1 isoform X2 [Anabrus simplex]|uniref:oxidation resistance protein 1 isoform X2 n=1 Tax=Anabrus simplex TaxID=316456 RepID=UPI0035A302DF